MRIFFYTFRYLKNIKKIKTLVALSVLTACSAPHPPATERSFPVQVASVVAKNMPEIINAVGVVEPINSVAVKSRVDGQLLQSLVKDGEEVRADQLLFRIDPRPFQAQLAQAQAAQTKDEAQLAQARSEEKRYADLVKRGVVSQEQYQQSSTALNVALAAIKLDAAMVAAAKLNVGYTEIRAPIAGRVGRILLQPGNLVKANDAQPLMVLNQMAPIYVAFAVPASLFEQVRMAHSQNPLMVRIKSTDNTIDGELAFVDNAIDAATGTAKLRGRFANMDERLWPGQFVNVELTLGHELGAVVVPDLAVKVGPNGSYVFVVKPDSHVEQRAVAVARSLAGESVIEHGVAVGEAVVVDGQSRLADGVRVTVSGAQP